MKKIDKQNVYQVKVRGMLRSEGAGRLESGSRFQICGRSDPLRSGDLSDLTAVTQCLSGQNGSQHCLRWSFPGIHRGVDCYE